jgi:hypothetical protein
MHDGSQSISSPFDSHVLYLAILIVQSLDDGVNAPSGCVIVVMQEVRLAYCEDL